MRRLPMIMLLATMAACSDAPPPTALPQQQVTASFPPGGVVDLIRIDALDTLALRSAELLAPDGTLTPATYLTSERAPQTDNGQATINDPWRSSMFGAGGVTQLPNAPLAPTVRSQQTLLLTVSLAEIPLPDPVAYRRDWAKYRIRLTFAATGSQPDVRDIPAPEPPAARPPGSQPNSGQPPRAR